MLCVSAEIRFGTLSKCSQTYYCFRPMFMEMASLGEGNRKKGGKIEKGKKGLEI